MSGSMWADVICFAWVLRHTIVEKGAIGHNFFKSQNNGRRIMKRNIVIGMLAVLLSSISGNVSAAGEGVNGLFIGGASGAALGQAIGRDTESTIVGTAVGTILGYVIGNEMEKKPALRSKVSYQTPQPRSYRSRHYRTENRPRHPQYQEYQEYAIEECQATEVLATINGRPEKITGVACYENGRWVVRSPDEFKRTQYSRVNNRWANRPSYYQTW